ncbi:peptidoglycan endopeptidase [Roseimicrobium sp. ORNL1]|uniref:peptidoglycan endopeptidase n=1 Tax=Roseimicrobium sp. ORNL1 TaxID=2711231 RepID=UPI001F109389|nr:peptidoglycan endopeptidase [Roseimicrobium sp. ORNL1]
MFCRRLLHLLLACIPALLLANCSSAPKDYAYRFVPGKTAVLEGRYARAPKDAPEAVKRAIAAGNRLVGKPYIYGGGHRRVEDVGYDCSGTASYVLYHAGLLRSPISSTEFRDYGSAGAGKWITLYPRRGHVFTVIAGLRLDTGYNGQGEGPQWSTRGRPAKGAVLRHPPGL